MTPNARLIGLDWGTTHVRAYLFDDAGTICAERAQPWGVLATPNADFAAAYHDLVEPWRAVDAGVPAIACGMIGSSEGWRLAPYGRCPAGAADLAARLMTIATAADGDLHVIGGVDLGGARPDVMRGEETQVIGALALRPERAAGSTLLLPGTHAKWVDVRDAQIVRFTTYLTGELYAVLRDHSILGRPARTALRGGAGPADGEASIAWGAFDRGVETAQRAGQRGIAAQLFLTRSLVLHDRLAANESLDFLSGLLIGDEIASGLSAALPEIAIVGAPALCRRYERALAAFGVAAAVIDGAAPAGLWDVACRAGLVAAPVAHG